MYHPKPRQTPLEDELLGMSEWPIVWPATGLQEVRTMDSYLSAIHAIMGWTIWSSNEAPSHL